MVHEKAKHFECSICIKKFRHRLHLQKHIKKAHRDAKIFECIIWAEFFRQKCALWEGKCSRRNQVLSAAFALTNFQAISALYVFEGSVGAAYFEEKSASRQYFKITCKKSKLLSTASRHCTSKNVHKNILSLSKIDLK